MALAPSVPQCPVMVRQQRDQASSRQDEQRLFDGSGGLAPGQPDSHVRLAVGSLPAQEEVVDVGVATTLEKRSGHAQRRQLGLNFAPRHGEAYDEGTREDRSPGPVVLERAAA